jgi:glycerol-3-phosphate dehydrogenase subunit C
MRYLGKKLRARDFILSRTDLMGSIATRAAPFFNFFLRLFPVKFLLDHFFLISGKATLPEYKSETFKAWYKKNRSTQNNFKEKVIYFHGCYVNYNDNNLGKAVISLMNAMEIGVVTVDEKCCGVPLIANSYLDKAKKNARFNIDILGKAVKDTNMKIVSTSSSCMLALKHEYPGILTLDTRPIAPHLAYITEFIHKQFELKGVPIMSPLGLKAVYHAPCHLERMGGVIYTIGVLKMIPGLRLTVLHSECCGISGTYGFKKECSQICEDVGADLFSRIESLQPDIVVSDCETCKWQIEMNTKYKVAHPVELLAMAIEA